MSDLTSGEKKLEISKPKTRKWFRFINLQESYKLEEKYNLQQFAKTTMKDGGGWDPLCTMYQWTYSETQSFF